MVDKFILYRKIKTLNYHLLVEPDKYLVHCNTKDEKGEWEMNSSTKIDEIISLPKLNISIPLTDIYRK